MPIPIIPIALGAARFIPAAFTACTKALGLVNRGVNTALGGIVATALVDQATDGRSTRIGLDVAESVIGEHGVRRVLSGVRSGMETLGKGLIGVSGEIEKRYNPNQAQAPIIPPITRAGLIVSSVSEAVAQDGRILFQNVPSIANSFDRARLGQEVAPKSGAGAAQQFGFGAAYTFDLVRQPR